MSFPAAQLRRVTRFAYGDSLADAERVDGHVPVYGSNGRVGQHDWANTQGPAIIIGRKGSFGKLQFSSVPVFAIDTTFFVDATQTDADLRWLYYALESLRLDELSEDVGVPGLSREKAYAQRLPLPPPHEQRAIADYLDRETARIDALIAAKERLVSLLTGRTTEMVADRLLGPPRPGAAPGVAQVESRLGWSAIPFRWLFREVDERSSTGDEPLLSVSQTRGVIPQSELGDRRQYAETLVGYKVCRPGDLVVNRMWVYYGALGASKYTGLVSPDYAVFRPTRDVTSEFAAYVLRTTAYVAEMTRLVRGIGAAFQGAVRKPRLHPNELGLIDVPVPPADQQTDILRQLDADTKRLTDQAELIQRSVQLLLERRQALITAAVTGQIEIPVAA